MLKRRLTYGLLLPALLLLGLACSRELAAPGPGGVVSIRFATGELQSARSVTPGDGVVEDGGGLFLDGSGDPDLVVLITDSNGDVVITYPGANAAKTSATATEAVISFDFSDAGAHLPAGNYTVYAFGNTAGLWTMTTDPYDPEDPTDANIAVELSGAQLTTLTTAAQIEALRFKAQPRNIEAWDHGALVQNSRLPVAAKASLAVSSRYNGEARLELIRCVAKVTAYFINNLGEGVDLYDYIHTIYRLNPTTGYVFQRPNPEDNFLGEAGMLVANPCARLHDENMAIHLTASGSQEYNWYVFPCDGPFRLDLSFTLYKGHPDPEDPDDPYTERAYTYTNLPVTNWRAENIVHLRRNQHLTITTRLSKGVQVSFNFEVADWTEHTASVTFD